jgi:uncharacterized membrane protein YeaQ/YmgE (transglycosylase-associated protein family)
MENAHIWIFTGAVIGMIAVVLDKGLQHSSLVRIGFGLAGGFLGGWLLTAFEVFNFSGATGHVVRATAGAAMLLFVVKIMGK